MEKETSKQFDKMTGTPIPRLIIALGIPTTVSMLVTNIYNMADTYFVSKLGTSASGAVGVVFGLMAILQAIGFMFGHGAGSIISRKLGEKDGESASRFASTSFFCSLTVGILLTVLGVIFINPLMRLLGSTDTILPFAREYGVFILLAAPLMVTSFVMNNILRYEGKAALAMIGLGIGGILNILGDWLLIVKCGMGVEGAGISTAVSQMLSFLILLAVFLTGRTESRFSLRFVSRKREDILWILKTGFPSLVRQGLASISTMLLNGQAGLYGDAAVAAMAIVNRICNLIFSVGIGIGQGFQPVSAFNYGARRYDRVRKAFFFTWAAAELLLGCIALAGFFLSSGLVGFFRNDPQVIAVGTAALRAQLAALFFQPLSLCANMLFQSIGKSGQASFLAALRSGILFIPAILILPRAMGLTGVEIAQTVCDILAFFIAIPFVVRFFRRLPLHGPNAPSS